MEDDPERVALPRAQPADPVAHVDAIAAARPLHRAVVDREGERIALPQRDDLGPALHPRALFGEDELAAGEILVRRRQQDRDLDRKDELAVQILMQAIIVSRPILQQ